jgi:hypothetical protein
MQLVCPSCQSVLEFSGAPPRFCGYCGRPLGSEPKTTAVAAKEAAILPPRPPDEETATLPPRPYDPEAATLAPPARPGESAEVPQVVGNYRLIRRLGEGGMGTVWEAEEVTSGRHVALKLISPDFVTSAETVERFRQEGLLASKIIHPRCVFVYAADEVAGQPYIAMELMPGQNLQDLVAGRGPLPPEEAIARVLDALEGLEEAHRLGVIHRDIKPSNLFLGADGRVKIGDFGLAKSLSGDVKLTRTGAFLGTPLYASPEQIRAEPLGPQSDVYSLAATLYFLLTGRAPHQTGDAAATIARIVADPAPSLRTVRPDLPKALDRAVLRGLERDRKRRYRNLDEFRRALVRFLLAQPSIGDTGVRFLAYMLDTLVLGAIGTALRFLGSGGDLNFTLGLQVQTEATAWAGSAAALVGVVTGTLIFVLYFGLTEGTLGWSPGKWLFRLRVCRLQDAQAPGILPAMTRALVLVVLSQVSVWYQAVAVLFAMSPTAFQMGLLGSGVAQFLAIGLLYGFMRKRNGYRGLHEWLSGTRTLRLTWSRLRKRRGLQLRAYEPELCQPAEMPERLGLYRVRGALLWGERERVLVGEDPSLGRRVWLWLRPATAPALDQAARDTNRATRVRWVACGAQGDWQWDAFLAPTGCPLPMLVSEKRGLAWPEARILLEDLAQEMAASLADGSLPEVLRPEQVWIEDTGRIQLLAAPTSAAGEGAWADGAAERALGFLREVLVQALEGKPRPAHEPPAPVRAAIPLHAAALVNRTLGMDQRPAWWDRLSGANLLNVRDRPEFKPAFTSVAEVLEALKATEDKPVEVARWRRAGHLVLQALFLCLPCLGPLMMFGPTLAVLLEAQRRGQAGEDWGVGLGFAVVCVVFWVLWSFAFRGGIVWYRGGLALVRRDGRRVARWQCALRTLLVWLPIGALLGAAVALARFSPEVPVLYFGAYGLACGLVVLFTFLAIWSPTRAPHDRLVGTYIVPH